MTEMLETAALGATGLLAGSFIGLLTLRLPAGQPVLVGRSACAGCGRKLGPMDLVPLLSWAASRGRCRTCASAIPARYPVLEAGCGLVGLWSSVAFDGSAAGSTALLGWLLILIAFLDAEHFWLPRRLTVPLAIGGLAFAVRLTPSDLPDRLIGALTGWFLLVGLAWLYRRVRGRDGLGDGDPLMLAGAGAWVGWQGLPSVLLIAAGCGVVYAAATRKLHPTARLPFGTLLAVGLWLTWLFGPIGLGGR